MNPAIFHESRFGAQAHERRRGAPGPQGHEVRALRAAHEFRPQVSSVRPGDSAHQARPPASRRQAVRHPRAAIHARHLSRVEYREELRQYRLEVRQWRHLLTQREGLLRKLRRLQSRLGRMEVQKAK